MFLKFLWWSSSNRTEKTYCQACIFMTHNDVKKYRKSLSFSFERAQISRACLQRGRVILESGLTLAAGQKIARVHPTTLDDLMYGCTQRVWNQVESNLSWRVNPTWSVSQGKSLTAYQSNPTTRVTLVCLVNTTKKIEEMCV